MQIFIKEKWIASGSSFNGFVQLRSALEIVSSCTIMRPPTKLQVFANFWPKKRYNPLSPPKLSRFISARLFSVPQVENEVKRTPLCWWCWDPRSRNWWIKEGPKKRNFWQLVRKCTTVQKPVYIPMELILNEKFMCLPRVSSIFKKPFLKPLDRTVYTGCFRRNSKYFRRWLYGLFRVNTFI